MPYDENHVWRCSVCGTTTDQHDPAQHPLCVEGCGRLVMTLREARDLERCPYCNIAHWNRKLAADREKRHQQAQQVPRCWDQPRPDIHDDLPAVAWFHEVEGPEARQAADDAFDERIENQENREHE